MTFSWPGDKAPRILYPSPSWEARCQLKAPATLLQRWGLWNALGVSNLTLTIVCDAIRQSCWTVVKEWEIYAGKTRLRVTWVTRWWCLSVYLSLSSPSSTCHLKRCIPVTSASHLHALYRKRSNHLQVSSVQSRFFNIAPYWYDGAVLETACWRLYNGVNCTRRALVFPWIAMKQWHGPDDPLTW
jgi:hypothetical protein